MSENAVNEKFQAGCKGFPWRGSLLPLDCAAIPLSDRSHAPRGNASRDAPRHPCARLKSCVARGTQSVPGGIPTQSGGTISAGHSRVRREHLWRGSSLALDCAAIPPWGPLRDPAGASSLATVSVHSGALLRSPTGINPLTTKKRPLPPTALTTVSVDAGARDPARPPPVQSPQIPPITRPHSRTPVDNPTYPHP
jgi:hypothetical protein